MLRTPGAGIEKIMVKKTLKTLLFSVHSVAFSVNSVYSFISKC